jgi:ketosteroid isomerase-like protein
MTISTDDVVALQQLTSQYCYLIDAFDVDAMHQIYTDDAIWDLTSIGASRIEGLSGIQGHLRAIEDLPRPFGHYLTCVHVDERDGEVVVRSKYFLPRANADTMFGELTDIVVRTEKGWRVRHRSPTPAG